MKRCHNCGAEWTGEAKRPGFKEYCEQCSAWLHCCLNCRFYDPAKHNQCHIPTTEFVADKAAANFCDEFEFATAGGPAPEAEAAGEARNALNSLFGEGESRRAEDRLDDFDKLFDQ